jgi:hypothetical protein
MLSEATYSRADLDDGDGSSILKHVGNEGKSRQVL